MERNEVPISKKIPAKRVVLIILAISVYLWVVKGIFERDKLDKEFVEREINGIILKIHDKNKGPASLEIKLSSGEEVSYDFSGKSFLRENRIERGDSISKAGNSKIIFFHSRNRSGGFDPPIQAELP